MAGTPALIKAYLRLGGFVGEGAWIDHAFNTTDVCLVMDTAQDERPSTAISTRRKQDARRHERLARRPMPRAADRGAGAGCGSSRRGVVLAVFTYGWLVLLLLLVRLIERPLVRANRPVTPWITQFVCRVAFPILGLRPATTRHADAATGGGGGQPCVLAGHLHAERGAAGLFRGQIRGGGLARYRLAGAGDGHGVHRPQGHRGQGAARAVRGSGCAPGIG